MSDLSRVVLQGCFAQSRRGLLCERLINLNDTWFLVRSRIHTCTHSDTRVCKRTRARERSPRRTHTWMCACRHAGVRTSNAQAPQSTHTCTHTRARTHARVVSRITHAQELKILSSALVFNKMSHYGIKIVIINVCLLYISLHIKKFVMFLS